MQEYFPEPECPSWLEAERLIKRLAEVEAEQAEAINALKNQIERVKEETQHAVDFIHSQLHKFYCHNPELWRKAKTQTSIQMGSAKLVLKKPSMSYKHDDALLLPWAKANGLVRVKEEPAWADIKARIQQTGEIPDGVVYSEDPEEFKVVFNRD